MKSLAVLAGGIALAGCPGAAAPALLLHWDFERIADRRVPDASGQNRHGTVHGAPRPEPGVTGMGLRFGSNADYVDAGAPVIPPRDFTLSAWVHCDDVEKQFFLGQYRYADPRRLDLAVREGAVRIQVNEIIDSPKLIQPRRWYHLAYVRSGERLTTYVDGKVVVEGRLPAEVLQTENLIVGKIVVPKQDSFRFTGVLDELKIWAGALSAADVRREYERITR